jgi:hypothetical protein
LERTGGRFSGGDEETIVQAILYIYSCRRARRDEAIALNVRATRRLRWQAGLWCLALVLRFAVPAFQTFPGRAWGFGLA